MNKAKKKKQVAAEPLQEAPNPMCPCEPAAPPVETFEELVIRATRSMSPEKTRVHRLSMEYGAWDDLCRQTKGEKRWYYLEAKALKLRMRAARARQNLVPKARTKKELAERKADEKALASLREEYHACGPVWREQHAYRSELGNRFANAKIVRLERLLRDAGGEW